MTHGELALVVFIFGLVYSAVLLPRIGERVAVAWWERRRDHRR